MHADGKTLVMILVFAAVFTAAQAAIGLFTTATQKRRMNQRLKIADKVDGVAALVIELRKQRGLTASGERAERLKWLSKLIVASGLPYDQKKWITYVAAAALIGGIGGFAATHMPLMVLLGAALGGIVVPVFMLKVMAGRRAKKLGAQLPQALEIIVRSLEAGHPVPTAIALVGREMSDPVGSEFGMSADEIAYGATLAQAIERMSERCQHPDVDLFAATVRLQERAGGNLTGLLKLNAATVRDRHKMRLKIKAASAEGRVSAMILTSAPFVAFGLINITNPRFYGDVSHEPMVRYGLIGLLGWLFIGNLVMRRMIDMRL
ncbi:MAG: type II secretion system F family protein [Phenylobacterium sp.]|nr:MAG: type II secretion system F family protein [Phenylobacterium sp.]